MAFFNFFITLSLFFLSATASHRVITEAAAPPLPAITQAPDGVCSATSSMPVCGVACLASAASAAGCPDLLNFPCQCKSSAQIRSLASGCVLKSCGPVTAVIVDNVGHTICSQCA